ncbi:MAG TPA: ribosome biogenesis GTPase Der [Hyphomicrobiaceae bacterium]|nr:ribosome biogenesis GTPase Der [Hyphomicrobiaceae bacterium]
MSGAPVIAIVGRPNVGKSTLFNRLTGKRQALVAPMPGLTRDRREGEATIAGQRVAVIDTAGLEEGGKGSLAQRMRKQTEAAIAKADLVLFVIDAREGVVPADQTFARAVLASGKPAILVANKCEGRRGTDGLYEAFALGLGEPVAISAEHGEGIGDLEQDIAAALGLGTGPHKARIVPGADANAARPIRIAIVGRPNVGKSTLLNALVGEERMLTGPEPGLTRDAVASDLMFRGRALRLYDTAGLRRKAKVREAAERLGVGDTLRAIRFAEVVILVVDAERGLEHQDLSIGDLIATEGRAMVIALNKWDLVADKQAAHKRLRAAAAAGLAQVPGLALMPVSALAERGLDKLIDAVLAAYEAWNRRIATPELNRWLQEALARHAPPVVKGRSIRIRYMTQPSTRPPTFVAFCQRAEDLPQAYVRYLSNSLREAFDLPGVPIRFKLRKGENPYAGR